MTSKRTGQVIVIVILSSILFALAYSQASLYTSNQYQYFLHGLARAEVGNLSEDWLANTIDPTPLFSLQVFLTEGIHASGLFSFYYAFLMSVYLFSLVSIVSNYFPITKSFSTFLLFLCGVILVHSAGLRFILSLFPGADWRYLFEGGVAGQRLLGQVFQPSSFGVFLLLSVAFYHRRKYFPASLAAVLASLVHPTYFLCSAVLILVYMLDLFFLESQRLKAFGTGFISLLMVSPMAIYIFINFTGGSPEITARAQEILINIRIPHHAQISEWFDITVVAKLLLIGTAILITRTKRIYLLLGFPLGISILLTLIQYFTNNHALALIFPWRLTTLLVPIATAILLGKVSTLIIHTLKDKHTYLYIISLIIIFLAVLSGIFHSWFDYHDVQQSNSTALENHVKSNRLPGEVYLIPVKLYTFRLNAGVPVYGEFFAIPYQSEEVIEWYSRFLNAKHFYEEADCTLLIELANQGVTHVILERNFPTMCEGILQEVYSDNAYRLLTLTSP